MVSAVTGQKRSVNRPENLHRTPGTCRVGYADDMKLHRKWWFRLWLVGAGGIWIVLLGSLFFMSPVSGLQDKAFTKWTDESGLRLIRNAETKQRVYLDFDTGKSLSVEEVVNRYWWEGLPKRAGWAALIAMWATILLGLIPWGVYVVIRWIVRGFRG